MKLLWKLFVLILTFSACQKKDDVEIRIENVSNLRYETILVGVGIDQKAYEGLNPSSKSKYQQYTIAFRYNSVKIYIDNVIYTFNPIDYVGEVPLEPGKYTYQVNAYPISNDFGNLSIDLKKD